MATHKSTTSSTSLLTHLGVALGGIADGDTVRLNKFADRFATDTDLSTKDLLLFHMASEWEGRAQADGGAGFTLVCNRTSTGKVVNESKSPRVEIASTSSAGVIYEVENAPAAGGVLQMGAMDCNKLIQQKGTAIVGDTCDLNILELLGGVADVRRTASYTLSLIRAMAGALTLRRDFTNMEIKSDPDQGRAVVTLEDELAAPSGAIDLDGGELRIVECGTVAQLNGYSGILDVRKIRNPITFTASLLFPGLKVYHSLSNTNTITWNATERRGGAQFIPFP
jgi:hypothetical protein